MSVTMRKERKHATKLRELGACLDAIKFADAYANPVKAWQACPWDDWMFWLIGIYRDYSPIKKYLAAKLRRDNKLDFRNRYPYWSVRSYYDRGEYSLALIVISSGLDTLAAASQWRLKTLHRLYPEPPIDLRRVHNAK